MDIKQKILRFLIENKDTSPSINKISKSLRMDYKLIYINIGNLEKDKSIKVEDLGSIKRCRFDDDFNKDVFIVENERKKQFLENKKCYAIYERLTGIKGQFILLLFGSYVKGTETKNSDIDLLLVSNKDNVKIIEEKLEILPLKIHLTSINYNSFSEMIKNREQTVVSEAIKKNIILFGVEDNYRLLKNA